MTQESRPVRTAAIIAVGSELLTPFRSDTNSLAITGRLNEIGIEVASKQIVGDNPRDLATAVTAALERADLVVVTGGLGPTSDDVTRPTIARMLDLPLEENGEVLERIRQRFAGRGLAMPEINRGQAMVPRGATALANANGTAPGLWIKVEHRRVLLLPGPPREMQPMLDVVVREYLAPSSGNMHRTPPFVYTSSRRVAIRRSTAFPTVGVVIFRSASISSSLSSSRAARPSSVGMIQILGKLRPSGNAIVLIPDLPTGNRRALSPHGLRQMLPPLRPQRLRERPNPGRQIRRRHPHQGETSPWAPRQTPRTG